MLSSSLSRWCLSSCLAAAMLLGSLLVSAEAQPRVRPRSRNSALQVNVFLPAPRELQRALSQAKEDLKNERYVDAITRLDLILRGGDGENTEFAEDYFLPNEGTGALHSLKAEAQRILSALSPEGQRAYELQLGTDARKQLDRAVAIRDVEALIRISGRYGSTLAGQEATLLLGRDRLERGRPLEAVLHLRRLADSQTASTRFGAELQILLATSLVLSGRESEASKRLLAFRTKNGSTQLTIRGKKIPTFDEGENPINWLNSQAGELSESIREILSEWHMFGGNGQRSGVSDVDMPLRSIRWDVDFAIRPDEEAIIDRHAKSLNGQAATPTLHPLVVDGWVLMRSADQLWGIEVGTGRRIWEFPWSKELESANGLLEDPYGASGTRRANLLKNRVWDDSLYGQLSSDGERIFLLNKLTGDYNIRANGMPVSNELVALELRRQGYSLWIVGGYDGRDEPNLAGVFFLGPPLPVRDKLYCIGELNAEIRLMALNTADGKLSWSQQLAHVDQRRSASVGGVRRKAGLNSSHADGVLVCPTSVGGVVAVDLASHAFLWGFRYKPRSFSRSRYGITNDRWRDNWTTIAQGKVILAPLDSNHIFCLDLLTGKRIWSQSKSRGSNLYVAGVHGDQVLLVGNTTVSTVDINTGQDGWSLTLRGNPAGRGVQSSSHYLLSTTTSELIKIDLDTGKVVESITTDEPLGNLVAYQDQIIAQNPKRLQAFYQRSKLKSRVNEMLRRNPNDPWALEHDAIMLLEAGDKIEGLSTLRRAIANYHDNDSGDGLAAKQLLVTTALEMLRDNEPGATGLAKEIEPLIVHLPDKRNEFLRVMAVKLQREGEVEAAFSKNLDLYQSQQSRLKNSVLSGTLELMAAGNHRQIRQDRWHRTLFRELWNAADDIQRNALTHMVQRELRRTLPANLPLLVDVLQDIPAMRQSQIDVIRDQLVRKTASPVAEALLTRLAVVDDEAISGQAIALLASLYRSSRRYAAAAAHYHILQNEYRNKRVNSDLTGAEFVEAEAKDNKTVRRYLHIEQAWPYGRVTRTYDDATAPPVRVGGIRTSQPFDSLTRLVRLPTERPFSWMPFGLALVYDQVGHSFHGRDGMGNVHPLVSLGVALPGVRGRDLRVLTNGHYIVASRGSSLVAINGLTADPERAILWKESGGTASPFAGSSSTRTIRFGDTGLTRKIQSAARGKSIIALGSLSDRGLVVCRYGELVCLDPINGEIVWIRNDISLDAEIWGDDEYVFAHVPGHEPGLDGNARVFSAMDGRELESRPVPDQWHRIRTFGQYVLSWTYDVKGNVDEDVDKVLRRVLKAENNIEKITMEPIPHEVRKVLVNRIQLNDVFEREKTYEWAHTFGFGAKVTFVGQNELAVFEPDEKKFTVFSIRTGEVHVDQSLDVSLSIIDEINVEKRAGLYVLRLSQYTNGRVGSKIRYRAPNPAAKLQNMEIFACSQSGDPVWKVPAKVNEYMPTDFFAADIPILVFIRRNENANPKRQLETLILDVRDGRAILEDISLLEGQTFQVRGDQNLNHVRVRVPGAGAAWKLQFTNAPRAPSPPYGHSTAVSRGSGGSFGVVGSFIKAITAPFQIDTGIEREPRGEQ